MGRVLGRVIVGRWSYLWAGLFGCLYVAVWGRWRQMGRALSIDLAYLLLAFTIVGGSFLLRPEVQFWVILLTGPLLLLFHGAAMVRLVRDGDRPRRWWVQRA